MNFVTGFLILADKKDESYNSILVIVNRLTKIIYYELVKITIKVLGQAKVIINIVKHHHKVLEAIIPY